MKKILSFIIILSCIPASALTVINLAEHDEGEFSRFRYPEMVLKLALDKTIKTYGKYKINYTIKIRRNRALVELMKGEKINVHEAPTRSEWEKKVIPIYFPIRKGLLGYRLLLIKKQNQHIYDSISNLNQLKKLRAGTGSQWSVTKLMESQKFSLVKGRSYEGLFGMLSGERFDYFPRGINEIFGELKNYGTQYPELTVENNLAIYIPLPSYIFVSPKYPELAKRIREGLNIALNDGSFDELFNKYQQDNIERANLNRRKIFRMEVSNTENPSIFQNKRLWYNPKSN
jgi:hypothetical protein